MPTDNIIARALLSTAQGVPVRIKASQTAGVYMLNTEAAGTVALIIPGVMQADNQNLHAPLKAKDNGDGTYTLVTA